MFRGESASNKNLKVLTLHTPYSGAVVGSATRITLVCGSIHSMLGMTAYRIWSPSNATQTKRRPCSSMWKFSAYCLRLCKLNLHTRISIIGSIWNWEVGGDPVLFPAEPNQFSAVVDKVMVGSTVELRRLADEAMKVVYMPSESHRLQASLPKNHVQPQFDINLRLTTLNFYENREKTSGVC